MAPGKVDIVIFFLESIGESEGTVFSFSFLLPFYVISVVVY